MTIPFRSYHNQEFSKTLQKYSHTWCWSIGLTGGCCCWSCGGYWELWSIRASLNPNRQSWAPGCTEEQLLLAATARHMQMKLSCASIMVGGIHLGGTKAITKMTVCVFPSSGGQQEEPLAGANNAVCTAQRDWLRRGRSRRTGTRAAYSLIISLITWGRHCLLSHTLLFDKDSLHNEDPVPSPSLVALELMLKCNRKRTLLTYELAHDSDRPLSRALHVLGSVNGLSLIAKWMTVREFICIYKAAHM